LLEVRVQGEIATGEFAEFGGTQELLFKLLEVFRADRVIAVVIDPASLIFSE
jgi:hypothetical protein